MQKWQHWQTASTADWSGALEREAVIRPLADQLRLTEATVQGAAAQLGLDRVTIYRLVRRYRQRPQTSSLLPRKRGRDRNSRFLEQSREDLIAACIKEFYLVPEQPSIAALLQEVRRRFAERRLPTPNYRTVVRRVVALDPRFVMTKRQGTKAAREKYGPVGVSTLRSDVPLEILQIDHTLVDVIVVDREHRLPIGRPWLTLAIDIATRAIVGFSVSLEAPSALSISLVLSHAVLPKATWLADRELHNLDWPMAGLPRLIHVDNAKEFHSEALLRGCQEYGIAINHRLPGQPHLGGHIERLIGTMMGAVHLLPGTTFSNVMRKGIVRFRGPSGSDRAGVGTMAGAANCRGLPPHRAFGAGQDSASRLAGGRGQRKAATSASGRAPKSSFWISCRRFRARFREMAFTSIESVTGTTC